MPARSGVSSKRTQCLNRFHCQKRPACLQCLKCLAGPGPPNDPTPSQVSRIFAFLHGHRWGTPAVKIHEATLSIAARSRDKTKERWVQNANTRETQPTIPHSVFGCNAGASRMGCECMPLRSAPLRATRPSCLGHATRGSKQRGYAGRSTDIEANSIRQLSGSNPRRSERAAGINALNHSATLCSQQA